MEEGPRLGGNKYVCVDRKKREQLVVLSETTNQLIKTQLCIHFYCYVIKTAFHFKISSDVWPHVECFKWPHM